MTIGEGLFLGLAAVAGAIVLSAVMVCMTWQDARERARSKNALSPPPGPAKSARRRP